MRNITSALSLATAMLLSISSVQAAEMNKDTRIMQAPLPGGPSHVQETNTQMNRAMDATMKNDAMKKEMLMAPEDPGMKTAAPGSGISDEAMKKDPAMVSKHDSMKTAAPGSGISDEAMKKDPAMASKHDGMKTPAMGAKQ